MNSSRSPYTYLNIASADLANTTPMVGLADCDNFFVSCECTVHPELIGRPVVVLSNNDGCIIARSPQAKALGIKMGEAVFKIRPLMERYGVVALSGNTPLYRDISLRVHEIIRRHVPAAIDYSVDESFLDVRGIPERYLEGIGQAIRREALRRTAISITVSFARSKTLAKAAMKQWKNTESHVGLLRKDDEAPLLATLPVQEIWGIGRRLTRRLYDLGVYSAAHLMRRPQPWVREKLGVTDDRLWLELHGQDCIDLSSYQAHMQQSISETRTFATDTDSISTIIDRVRHYACRCGVRLRAMNAECRQMYVFIQTNRFHPERGVHTPSIILQSDHPCSDSITLMQMAQEAVKHIYRPGYLYKRAGVTLAAIRRKRPLQPTLFSPAPDPNPDKLMTAIDHINATLGIDTIRPLGILSTTCPAATSRPGYTYLGFGSPQRHLLTSPFPHRHGFSS